MPKGIYQYKKGYHLSEEHKRKLSQINKGKKLSKETKEKISKNNQRYWLGKKMTIEFKEKIRQANLGKKASEETKKRMSETHKKIYPFWLKGRKQTESWKNKHIERMKLNNPMKDPLTRQKMSEALRGENGHNWKGGRTKLIDLIRKCWKYREWRNQIFERDNYTCQKCGIRGSYLEPHHEPRLSELLEKLNITTIEEAILNEDIWKLEVGITWCKKCHLPTYGRNKK